MKPVIKHLAQALVELSCTCQECDCGELSDAAIEYLRGSGCSRAQLRDFVRAVSLELHKSGSAIPIRLSTPSGKSGEHATTIGHALEKILGKKIELVEQAEKHLIGGAKIAYGDERFDYSISGTLARLESQLTAA